MDQDPLVVEEIIPLDGPDNGPPDDEYIEEVLLGLAAVSDVRLISQKQAVPADWHVLDGSTLNSAEWPDFVEQMRIQTAVFTLPEPQRSPEGHHFIIKLGERRQQERLRLEEIPDAARALFGDGTVSNGS